MAAYNLRKLRRGLASGVIITASSYVRHQENNIHTFREVRSMIAILTVERPKSRRIAERYAYSYERTADFRVVDVWMELRLQLTIWTCAITVSSGAVEKA